MIIAYYNIRIRFISGRRKQEAVDMAEMIERIEKVLEQDVRPSLLSHEGNVQIVSYEEKSKILRVRLTGQCSGCPSAQLTTEEVIEKAVKEKIPEVEQVLLVHEVSSELLDMARKILSRSGGSDDRAAGKKSAGRDGAPFIR
ncbi:NifU-like protein [[Clostridium] symbiosum ATCC 14940]|jgi:Fe-S cluster biogenesis protein NfuA|nr:NifU-like protein [[Clostridium] symbiosum ATCC 14940]